MKILFLSNLEYEGFAGPTYCVPALISALSEFDEVAWYNMKPVEHLDWRKLPFYRNPNDFKFDFEAICRRIWVPDLIVFEGFYAFHPGYSLLRVLYSGIPYVIEPHCALTSGDQAKKMLKKRICNLLFYRGFASGASAIHYLTERECSESGLRWNQNCFIEPNGIEMPEARPVRTSWHKDVPEIVYIGRIEPYQKGLDVLLEALLLLKTRSLCPKFHISVYGNSVNGSSELIIERIKKEGLDPFISLLNPVYGAEKDGVLRAADYFLLTSRYEGMPMGLLEACAYGLPSIVTPGTNMAEIIDDERAGWVADFNSESIADAINFASHGKDDYASRASAAFKVAEKYSWRSIAESIHFDYTKVVGIQ